MWKTNGFWNFMSWVAFFAVCGVIVVSIAHKERREAAECIRYPMTCEAQDVK